MFQATIFVVSPLIILTTDSDEQFVTELRLDYLRRLGNPPVKSGSMGPTPVWKDSSKEGDYRVWINMTHGVDKSFRLTSSPSSFEFAKLTLAHLKHCWSSRLRGNGMEKRTPEGWEENFDYLERETA